jgi:hypothetical protein
MDLRAHDEAFFERVKIFFAFIVQDGILVLDIIRQPQLIFHAFLFFTLADGEVGLTEKLKQKFPGQNGQLFRFEVRIGIGLGSDGLQESGLIMRMLGPFFLEPTVEPFEGILDARTAVFNFLFGFFDFSENHRQKDRAKEHGLPVQLGPLGFVGSPFAHKILESRNEGFFLFNPKFCYIFTIYKIDCEQKLNNTSVRNYFCS